MGDIKNIPELNFGLSSTEWNEFELGKITLSYSGGTPQSENPVYYGGDIPFIRSGEISSDLTSLHITQAALENSSAKLVEKGDILYALYGATSGEVSRSQIDGAINQAVMAIKPDEGFDFEFITQLLRKNKKKIINTFLQGGQGNLSGAIIKSLVFKFPEKTKQIQIGTFLKNLDDQITLKQRKLDKLVTLKKAMLEKMFPKDGADKPEIRFKGFSGGWNSELLDANADFAKGQGYSKSDLVEAGTPIVLYGRLYTKYESFISKVDTFVNAKPGSLFSKGCEVVVPASGETAEDIARASAILKEGVLLGGDLNIIYPNEKFTSVFLALSLSNGKVQKDLSKRAQGKSVVHVRNSDIKELEISFPSIEEQKAIGSYFKKLDNLISLQKTELTKLKKIKSSCLGKMFV